jgi:competence protein ComEC
VSIGILLGVLIAPKTGSTFATTEWLIIALALCIICVARRTRYLVLLACISGSLIGLWRGSIEQINLHTYSPYYKSKVIVIGRVTEDTSYGPKGDQRIRVGDVQIGDTYLPGTIWVSANSKASIKRGDIITLSGVLLEGFGNIPGSMFKAEIKEIIRPQPGDVGRRVRDWFGQGVERAIPGENAQLALAYLVGQKLTISDTLNNQLKTIGLIHAVVASGAHLTILIGAVRKLFVRLSKYLTALFSVGMIGGFILITGFSPSMTRAGLVTLLGLIAWYYGRVIHPFVLLPFAAAVTVLYSPAYVWGDIGWYLSFAAFSGVIVLTPLIHHYFWGKAKKPGFMRDVLVATVAAQIATLPIAVYAFGYFSVYALIANLLVVPLVPVTMLVTFVCGLIGLILPGIAFWFGLPLQWILEYMKWIINFLANLPGARNEVSFNIYLVMFSYAAIIGGTVYLLRVTKHDFRHDTELQHEF